jgi:hypothetical protein
MGRADGNDPHICHSSLGSRLSGCFIYAYKSLCENSIQSWYPDCRFQTGQGLKSARMEYNEHMNPNILSVGAFVLLALISRAWAADIPGRWIARILYKQGMQGETRRAITPVPPPQ